MKYLFKENLFNRFDVLVMIWLGFAAASGHVLIAVVCGVGLSFLSGSIQNRYAE